MKILALSLSRYVVVCLILLFCCCRFTFGDDDVNVICTGCSVDEKVFSMNYPNLRLKGQFPMCLATCFGITSLDLSNNKLHGPLPTNICNTIFPYITYLDLSNNNFSGPIPDLSNCTWLNVLLLQNNSFSGNVPAQLGLLPRLNTFSAAHNLLSGPLPEFNNIALRGPESYADNPGLCGGPLKRCKSPKKPISLVRVLKSNSVLMVGAAGFGISFAFSFTFFVNYSTPKRAPNGPYIVF